MEKIEPRARAPTKPDGSVSATGSTSAWGVVLFALQCAQRIGQWLTLLFVVHVLSTQVALLVDRSLAPALQGFMATCQPTYNVGIAAYFGKAAVENTLKIWTSIKSLGSTTIQTKASDSNG